MGNSGLLRHPEEFLAFFRQCAERYGRKVRYIEVFNEPNLLRFWQEPPNPEAYAELLKKAAALVRRCAPGVKIVYGGLDGADARYLEATPEIRYGGEFRCHEHPSISMVSFPGK